MKRGLSAIAAVLAVGALTTACGQTGIEQPGARQTSLTADISTPVETASPSSSAPSVAAKITVPNGVGLNYQKAQDVWRAAGLVVGPARDATGRNRIPVLDSNWVVVSQDLKPGTKVPAGSVITATVKKYSDESSSSASTTTAPATTKPKVDLAARVKTAIGIGQKFEPTWAMPITKIEAMGSDGIRVYYQESLMDDQKVRLGQYIFNFARASDIKLGTIVVRDVSGVDFNVYCGKFKCAEHVWDTDL